MAGLKVEFHAHLTPDPHSWLLFQFPDLFLHGLSMQVYISNGKKSTLNNKIFHPDGAYVIISKCSTCNR